MLISLFVKLSAFTTVIVLWASEHIFHGLQGNSLSERAYGGESKSVRINRRRQAFLQAGLEVFGTAGYRKATVKQVCRHAGLADRYFYESFQTLEDLLVATYETQVNNVQQRLMSKFTAAPESTTNIEVVEICLREVFNAVRDPRVARVCWFEILGINPRVDQLYLSTLHHFATLLITLAHSRTPAWSLPPTTERLLGLSLVGAVSESIKHWLINDYQDDIEALVATNCLLFEGVFRMVNSA